MKTTSTLKTALVIFAAIIGLSANAKPVDPSPNAQVPQAAFSATVNNIKADLKWTAGAEGNVSHFVIEKSTDGVNYHDAAVVFAFETGSETLTYKFSEKLNNTDAVVYYRLCTIGKDGKYSYSSVQTLRTAQ